MITLINFCAKKGFDDASTNDFYEFICHDFYNKEGKLTFKGEPLKLVNKYIINFSEKTFEYLYQEFITTPEPRSTVKSFENKYGLFILDGCKLTLIGSNKSIEIESPETLDEERLTKIYKVVWDDSTEENVIDELGKVAYGLQAILPQSF